MLSDNSEGAKSATAQRFVYHRVRPSSGPANADPASNSAVPRLWDPATAVFAQDEEWQETEKEAFERGVQEGRNQAGREIEQLLDRARDVEREALAAAIAKFTGRQDKYFRDVEAEVVQLALGIARRILNREANIDPLVLAGVVRVALEKVATRTGLSLRVHPSRVDGWQEFFTRQTDLQSVPALAPDATLEPDACVLETAIGTTELSLETQLKEIEQGFFDLLDRRPRNSE